MANAGLFCSSQGTWEKLRHTGSYGGEGLGVGVGGGAVGVAGGGVAVAAGEPPSLPTQAESRSTATRHPKLARANRRVAVGKPFCNRTVGNYGGFLRQSAAPDGFTRFRM